VSCSSFGFCSLCFDLFSLLYADYGEVENDGSFRLFTYHQLKLATGNFGNKIGEGGFGSVYKVIYIFTFYLIMILFFFLFQRKWVILPDQRLRSAPVPLNGNGVVHLRVLRRSSHFRV
jgi:hypothetical protein